MKISRSSKPRITDRNQDLSGFSNYDVSLSIVEEPIENHPLFSKPDVRFRHARTRKAFKRIKELGIVSFAKSVFELTEYS